MDCDVWAVPVRTDPATELLTPEERDRAAAMRAPAVRNLFVTSRVAQREVLARYLNCPAGRVVVRRECADCGDPEHGRPLVEHGPPYSVSHSGDWVLIAVHGSGLVGVDLELIARQRVAELPLGVYTPAERAVSESLPDADRSACFYRTWTRKEAAAKAVSRGLAIGLATVDTLADRTTVAGRVLHLCDLPAPPGYAAALATSQPVRVRTRTVR